MSLSPEGTFIRLEIRNDCLHYFVFIEGDQAMKSIFMELENKLEDEPCDPREGNAFSCSQDMFQRRHIEGLIMCCKDRVFPGDILVLTSDKYDRNAIIELRRQLTCGTEPANWVDYLCGLEWVSPIEPIMDWKRWEHFHD